MLMPARRSNAIEVVDGVAYVDISTPLYPNTVTMIDEADIPLLESVPGGRWFPMRQRHAMYVTRTRHVKGEPKEHYKLHRVVIGASGHETIVDHADRNPLNNRRSNLRVASRMQNAANSRLRSTNTTGYRGVSVCDKTGLYKASIMVERRNIFLGNWGDAALAAAAYDGAARVAFGEFANMNFRESK